MDPIDMYHALVMEHRRCGLEAIKGLASIPLEEIYRRAPKVPGGVVVLSTCNRLELYWHGEYHESLRLFMENLYERVGGDECLVLLKGLDAARHLFRVASGLESMMIGENEVLWQVREALGKALGFGEVDRHLALLFERAVSTGRRVRRETGISRGAVSIPIAAVRLAERILGGLGDRRVVIVGAGRAGSIIARAAARLKPSSMLVLNRTPWRAQMLARRIGASWGGLDRLHEALQESDVVFIAAGGKILGRRDIEGLKRTPLIIDISVPPAVEKGLEGRIIWIDSLRRFASENHRRRLGEIPLAERIVEEEVRLFGKLVRRMEADRVISSIMTRLEELRKREVGRALKALRAKGLMSSDGVAEVLDAMSSSIVRKAMQPLYRSIREAADRGDYSAIKLIAGVMGWEE